jgi:hypothetical protein
MTASKSSKFCVWTYSTNVALITDKEVAIIDVPTKNAINQMSTWNFLLTVVSG